MERDSGTDEASEDQQALPDELFLVLFDLLERRNLKRTLANFAMASKQCYALALPILMKNLDFNMEATMERGERLVNSLGNGIDADGWNLALEKEELGKVEAKSKRILDFLRADEDADLKWTHVRSLKINYGRAKLSKVEGPSESVMSAASFAILLKTGRYLEHLEVDVLTNSGSLVWNALTHCVNLKFLRVGVDVAFFLPDMASTTLPSSLEKMCVGIRQDLSEEGWDTVAWDDDLEPLLQLMDRSPGFEIDLGLEVHGDNLIRFPSLISRIKSYRMITNVVGWEPLLDSAEFKPRCLEISLYEWNRFDSQTFAHGSDDSEVRKLWKALARMESLEQLSLHFADRDDIVDYLPSNLRHLQLRWPSGFLRGSNRRHPLGELWDLLRQRRVKTVLYAGFDQQFLDGGWDPSLNDWIEFKDEGRGAPQEMEDRDGDR